MNAVRVVGKNWMRPAAIGAIVALGAGCASAPAETDGETPASRDGGITVVEGGQQGRPDNDLMNNMDPRVGLAAGWKDAGTAAMGMELIAHRDRPEGFYDESNLGNLLVGNSDIAFQGNYAFVGSFQGFNIYDVSTPSNPRLKTSFTCPGGQGDLSVYGNLMFMSVEMPNGRVDCGTTAPTGSASPDRFRGVRIFDISDVGNPRQITGIQTCRGSHTHTLVTAPGDPDNVYVYVSGTSGVRPEEELAGCSGGDPDEDPNTALFRIEVIQVPLAAPQNARIVNAPRIFADASTGDIAGLWPGGAHGEGTQDTRTTNQCHDITVYEELDLAAGACSGNGILLDISDPANPVRVAEVIDPNFAYWHSATFSNDGNTVLYTDEWGGGGAPRCQASDKPEWGADAIFRRTGTELDLAGYYKLPAPQTALENCVAHNGSLVPVPGRDIMVQSWYQGGVSVLDFTDPGNAFEIAYFDRGPIDPNQMQLAGYWSSYWYNGAIYASEIGRGLDVFQLEPSDHLSANEIAAARLIRQERFNPQTQTMVEWPAEPVVAMALLDQLERDGGAIVDVAAMRSEVRRLGALQGGQRRDGFSALADQVDRALASATMRADSPEAERYGMLSDVLSRLAGN